MNKRPILLCLIALTFSLCQAQTENYETLMEQAKSYFQQKEYEKSSQCYERILTLIKGTPRERLASSLRDFIGINHLYQGVEALKTKDYPTAKTHLEQAIANAEPEGKTFYMAHSWMGNWHSMQSMDIRTANGNKQQALVHSQEAERYYGLAKAPKKQLSEQLARAGILQDLQRGEEAETLLRQMIRACEGNSDYDFIRGRTLYALGNIERKTERFEQALLHLEQGYDLCLAASDPSAPTNAYLCAFALTNLYEGSIPDTKKAALWRQRAAQTKPDKTTGQQSQKKEEFTAQNRQDVQAYSAEVQTYTRAVQLIVKEHKEDEGIALLTELIDQSKQRADFPPEQIASYYSARALGHQHKKRYQLAESDILQALTLLEQAGDRGKEDLTHAWMQLASVNYYMDKEDEAMTAIDKCVQAALDYYGPFHSETMDAYSFRSNLAGFLNKPQVALADRQKIFAIIQHNVEKNFTYLTADERTAYWNNYLPETTIMFAFAHKLNQHSSAFTDDLFNQQLLAKGLLLTAESTLQRAIDADPALAATYQQIRQLRKTASDNKTSPAEANAATLEADRLERSLSTSASALHQFMDFLRVHASDVRSQLTPADLAIEFVDYRVGKDSVMYAALVMSPQWKHVHLLPLFEQRELPAIQQNALAARLWQPILDIAPSGIKNIYFAPSGQLYQLPIESLQLADGRLMSDLYHMYRLSSTRWLALQGNQPKGKDAVIYGGLAYDSSITAMQQDAARYPQQRSTTDYRHNLREAIKGIPYLAGTKVEAENIVRTINQSSQQGLHADVLLGDRGTETSFKNLDGKFKRIIHIATHGFYQRSDSTDEASTANVLNRCGLFFAGAENKYMGDTLPQGLDDGILTAQEIADLDLRGLDLACLSACQTGQGDITADGVFGLQRSFKKAGGNSILMSLWKVDDQATTHLMTEFYRHWMSGQSKHDALEQAKRSVRSHSKWQDPQYWAAFILLDGVD